MHLDQRLSSYNRCANWPALYQSNLMLKHYREKRLVIKQPQIYKALIIYYYQWAHISSQKHM